MSTQPKVLSPRSHLQELTRRVRHPTSGDLSNKSMYFGKYVTQDGCAKLLTYEYHGQDNSLVYKHILSPMNNKLITFIPLWLAPNTITLLGLLAVALAHALLVYYCPLLEGPMPKWLYFVVGLAMFTYQTLDNLDGKQARRTETSSPLGLLFDHGCDAINVTIQLVTMACVTQMGPNLKTLILVMSAQTVFICATWEEYYCGSLVLPAFNGPTEGILIGIFLNFFTAFVGEGFWLKDFGLGIQMNTIFLIATTGASIATVFVNIINVIKAVRLRQDSIIVAFTRLMPFNILNGIAALWCYYSPSNILAHYPRLFFWMFGLLNSKLVLHMMLAHLCGQEYHPFRKTLVPIFYVAAHSAFSMLEGNYDGVNELILLKEFFFLSVVSYIHIVVTVIWEVKTALGIPVFRVPIENQRKALAILNENKNK